MQSGINYQELKVKHQEEFSNFPLFFAFNNAQFEEGLKKLNTTADNIVKIGMGGFIEKNNIEKFREFIDRHSAEMMDSFKNDDFLLGALVYELNNHEYCYTHDPADALKALRLKEEEIKPEILKKALHNCYNEE
jgi:hypothetical protein